MFNQDKSTQLDLIFKNGQTLYGHYFLDVRREASLNRSIQISFKTFHFNNYNKIEKDTFTRPIDGHDKYFKFSKRH